MPIERYGRTWPPTVNDLEIELASFWSGRTVEQGGLGKAKHFERCVRMLWPSANGQSARPCIWHPWLEDMAVEASRNKFLSISGCASSSKTEFAALWAIVNFLGAPWLTTVLVTSTTVEQSKLRIWGRVIEYWTALRGELPGRVKEKKICLSKEWWKDYTGQKAAPEVPGIELIAAEKSQTNQAIQKLIGIKAPSYGGVQGRLILIADELPDLSPSIITASISNLTSNKDFQLITLGNYKSEFDAFGQLTKPKGGWDTVTVDDKRWETERGICLHFDGLNSANWKAKENIYPIISVETIQEALDHLGPGRPEFWRMIRSFPSPIADENKVFNESEMRSYRACQEVQFTGKVTTIGGLDPSWTNGGDRTIFMVADYGDLLGLPTLYWRKFYVFKEDEKSEHPRSAQVAMWAQDLCIQNNIPAKYLAVDATGGIPFVDTLEDYIGRGIHRVFFYGAASDLPVSAYQSGPAKEYYVNRVSEIWHVGQVFLTSEQFKIAPDIYPDVARELTAREILPMRSGKRIQIQSKKDIKSLGFSSPDICDSGFTTLDLIRHRFGAVAGGISQTRAISRDLFSGRMKDYNKIYIRKNAYAPKKLQ